MEMISFSRRFIGLSLILILVGLLLPAKALALTPFQLMRYNRSIKREADFKITKEEYTAFLKFFKKRLRSLNYSPNETEIALEQKIVNKFYTLSPKELEVYKKLSQEKCLNILITTGSYSGEVNPGFTTVIYNGEYLGKPGLNSTGFPSVYYGHIAGDRLAYAKHVLTEDLWNQTHWIVDGEDQGDIGSTAVPASLLTPNQMAFLRPNIEQDPGSGTIKKSDYHLIFDGKDMGLTLGKYRGLPRIKEGHLIYQKASPNGLVPKIMMDGEELGEGLDADIEGKKIAIIGEDLKKEYEYLILDGKRTHDFGYDFGVGLSGENLSLKDGHLAYAVGPGAWRNLYRVFYDGKDFGIGTSSPFIEKDHLAYRNHPKDRWNELIYDGKKIGPMASADPSLSGDHFAFMQRVYPLKPTETSELNRQGNPDFLSKVNIDGKVYPGLFMDAAYVEIAKKSVCDR